MQIHAALPVSHVDFMLCVFDDGDDGVVVDVDTLDDIEMPVMMMVTSSKGMCFVRIKHYHGAFQQPSPVV